MKLIYLGHATTLVEMDGLRILTDPLLRNKVAHLQRRSTAVSAAHYQNIDVVLISHMHWDHLDLPSLRLLGKDVPLVVPFGAKKWLQRFGFMRVNELRVGEAVSVGKVAIKATYADHSGRRMPWNTAVHSLGFLIQGSQHIYFAGDTDLFPEMANLARNLDLALLPVWGWGPTLRGGHLNPFSAAQALALLKPRLAVPIHWGAFLPWGMGWLQPQFFTIPPHEFLQHAARLHPETAVHIVSPGDYLSP